MPKKPPLPANEAFEKAYADDAQLREATIRALAAACHAVDFPDEPPLLWQEVLDLIAGDMGWPMVEVIQGYIMPGAAASVYALAAYGWDGGNGITTKTVNLDELVVADAFGGPYASVVARTRPNIPGLAVQYYDAEDSLTLQFF